MLLDKTIHLRADPARVFPWLSPPRTPRWDTTILQARLRDDARLAPGARFDRATRAAGFHLSSTAEVLAAEPGHEFAWRQVAGDYHRHAGRITLDPVEDGTRLRFVAEVELPFVLPRMVTEEEVRRRLSAELDAALYALKEVVEAEDPSAPRIAVGAR